MENAVVPPRGRGRPGGFRMSTEHRQKIANSNVLSALIDHVDGKREMGATQVTAAIALLRKVMPDLASTTISGDDDADPVSVRTIVTGVPRAGDS